MRSHIIILLCAFLLLPGICIADNNGGGEVTGFADAGGPYSGIVGVQVNFTGAATGGTAPYTYQWDYDYDGITFDVDGTGDTSSHTYAAAGHYIVALNITDSTGNSSIDTATCDISSDVNQPPIVDFSWYPLFPSAGEIVRFTDLSHDYDGSIDSWRWEYGDGFTSFRRNPDHVYDSPGRYTVTLIVTDNDGQRVRKDNTITVSALPTSPTENYTLVVYTETDGRPLKDVTVTVNGDTNTTNRDGSARFTVPYGTVNITAEREGYREAAETMHISRDSMTVLSLEKEKPGVILPVVIVAGTAGFLIIAVSYRRKQEQEKSTSI